MRLIVLLLAACIPLSALDFRPYAGPEAPVYATRLTSVLEQWKILTVESYLKHGVHGPWDADLLRLLEHTAAMAVGRPGTMPTDEASALAVKLTAPNACKDPLAAWCAFRLATNRKARFMTGSVARKAFEADAKQRPDDQRHARLLEATVYLELLGQYGRTPKPEHRELVQNLADQLAAAIGDAIRKDECRLFPSVLLTVVHDIDLNHQDYGEPIVAAIDTAVAEAKPAAWVGLAMRGTVRIANAWAWRGSGWASTVTPEGWKGFERNLAEADTLLTQAWQANPADPLIPGYACTLAGAGNSATPLEEWLKRSTQACFDHPTAYRSAMNFLQPRWGGSYEQMLALGCDYLDTGRFDTEVPWRIVDAAQRAISDAIQMKGQAQLQEALQQPRVLAAIDSCLAGYLAKTPERAKRYACIKAAILWHAGRTGEARKALAGLAIEDYDAAVAAEFQVNFQEINPRMDKNLPPF